jgi:ketosteroid isomerase-like protein
MTDAGPGNVTVDDAQRLAVGFEEQRARLRAMAHRMLGSLSDADDALQEAWLRACRADTSQEADPDRQWPVVAAFLAAARDGDVDRLVAVLADGVVVRADTAGGTPRLEHGARAVARQAVAFSRHAASARLALVDGAVAVTVASQGRLVTALTFAVVRNRIVGIDIITEPHRLRGLDRADLPSR